MRGQDIGHIEVVFGSESALDMALCVFLHMRCSTSKNSLIILRLKLCCKQWDPLRQYLGLLARGVVTPAPAGVHPEPFAAHNEPDHPGDRGPCVGHERPRAAKSSWGSYHLQKIERPTLWTVFQLRHGIVKYLSNILELLQIEFLLNIVIDLETNILKMSWTSAWGSVSECWENSWIIWRKFVKPAYSREIWGYYDAFN